MRNGLKRIFTLDFFLKVLSVFVIFLAIAKFFLGKDLGEIISREAKIFIAGMLWSYIIFILINSMKRRKSNEEFETK